MLFRFGQYELIVNKLCKRSLAKYLKLQARSNIYKAVLVASTKEKIDQQITQP